MARADITLTAVDQTRAAFDSVKRNLGDVERVAGSLSSTLAGLGAGLSAGALIGFVRSSIDAADNLGKLSQKVGVTVESLSELQYAGKLADVSTEQLGDGLRKLSVNLTEAANGSKEMRAAFGAVDHNEIRRDAGFEHGFDDAKPFPALANAQLEAGGLAA